MPKLSKPKQPEASAEEREYNAILAWVLMAVGQQLLSNLPDDLQKLRSEVCTDPLLRELYVRRFCKSFAEQFVFAWGNDDLASKSKRASQIAGAMTAEPPRRGNRSFADQELLWEMFLKVHKVDGLSIEFWRNPEAWRGLRIPAKLKLQPIAHTVVEKAGRKGGTLQSQARNLVRNFERLHLQIAARHVLDNIVDAAVADAVSQVLDAFIRSGLPVSGGPVLPN